MRRLVSAACCFIVVCSLAACGAGGTGVPQIPATAGGTAARTTVANAGAPANIVAFQGVISGVRRDSFDVRTHQGPVPVVLSPRTVVHGRSLLRDGAYAQIVGRGTHPDRARYVALWNSAPRAISLTGQIGSSTRLGFTLVLPGSSKSTLIVLSSSTKVSSALSIGASVVVAGSGSIARGVVATDVTVALSPSPSPPPSPSPTVAPTATPTPVATPTSGSTPKPIVLEPGEVVGEDNLFTPPDGDSTSGGQGQTIDGIPCNPSPQNSYHVHIYVGLYVNGNQVAIPDQIGMDDPGPIVNGFTNSAKCFYYIHTHDASGMVHVESPSTAPVSASVFMLQSFFDVWGMTVSTGNVGPFSGPVRTFIGRAKLGTTTVYSSSYSEYTGDPNAIALYSHEAIWFEVGAPYRVPPNLPEVVFYTQY